VNLLRHERFEPHENENLNRFSQRSKSTHQNRFSSSNQRENIYLLMEGGERFASRNRSEKRFDRMTERSPSAKRAQESYTETMSRNKKRDTEQIKKLISTDIYRKVLDDKGIRRDLIKPLDIVVMEGELIKWHPGMEFTYIKRWVQVTKREIRWFKSKLKAYAWKSKPIFKIGFHEIKGAAGVNMKLPHNFQFQYKEPRKKVEKYFHFEIFPVLDEVASFPKESMYRGLEPSEINQPRNPHDATFKILNVKEGHLMCYPAKFDGEKPPSKKNKFLEYYPYDFDHSPIISKAMASKRSFSLKSNLSL
jgi:hypothetical protein